MLRLSFVTLLGDPPTLLIAPFLRFSADGTLRGPDNYLLARYIEGGWQVHGKLHRDLSCEGPVRVRLNLGEILPPRLLGPFREVHTRGGVLYAEEKCLNVAMPGRAAERRGDQSSLSMTFEGESNAKA
jgi:hypothetical protein